MEELAREIETALKADFPNARNLAFKAPGNSSGSEAAKTVSADIDATITRLQTIIKGLELLKAQL
jgi:hypothetical protein